MVRTTIRWFGVIVLAGVIVSLFVLSYNKWVFGPICLALLYLHFRTAKVGTFNTDGIVVEWPLLFSRQIILIGDMVSYRIGPSVLWVTTTFVVYYRKNGKVKKMALEIKTEDYNAIGETMQKWVVPYVEEK